MKLELYTDGGCRGNGQNSNAPAGIGCVLLIPDEEPIYFKQTLKFSPNTNNKAEIYAITRGIDLIFKYYKSAQDLENSKNFVKDELIIYSDSNYTIQGISNWIDGWRANGWMTASKTPVKNQELWVDLDNRLLFLKNYFDIKFVKVKGHAGNQWNEVCDQLANAAMDEL